MMVVLSLLGEAKIKMDTVLVFSAKYLIALIIVLVLVDDGMIGQLLAHAPSLPAMCLLPLSVFVEHQAPLSSQAHSSYETSL